MLGEPFKHLLLVDVSMREHGERQIFRAMVEGWGWPDL